MIICMDFYNFMQNFIPLNIIFQSNFHKMISQKRVYNFSYTKDELENLRNIGNIQKYIRPYRFCHLKKQSLWSQKIQ